MKETEDSIVVTKQIGGESDQPPLESAVAHQSNEIHKLKTQPEQKGRITDCFVELSGVKASQEPTGVSLSISEDGAVTVSTPERVEAFRKDVFNRYDKLVTSVDDLSPELVGTDATILVPTANSDGYVRVELQPEVFYQVELDDLVEPLYYSVSIEDTDCNTLKELFGTYGYFTDTESNKAEKFTESQMYFEIETPPNISIRPTGETWYEKKFNTVLETEFSDREIMGGLLGVPISSSFLYFGLYMLADTSGSLPPLLNMLSVAVFSVLVVGCMFMFEYMRHTGKKEWTSFITNSQFREIDTVSHSMIQTEDSHMDDASDLGTQIKVDVIAENTITLSSTTSDKVWELPTSHGTDLLTESSTQFLKSVGFENIGSTVEIYQSSSKPTTCESCIRVDGDYLYTKV